MKNAILPVMLNPLVVVVLAFVLPAGGQQNPSPASPSKQEDKSTQWTVPCIVKEHESSPECDWSKAESESYLKRLFGPENLPNVLLFAVGFGGILLAFRTLRTIEAQTKELILQNRTMVAKERARIEIDVGKLEVEFVEDIFWCLTTTVELRNIGSGRAFITRTGGQLKVEPINAAPPAISANYLLTLPERFLDPAETPTRIKLFSSPGEDELFLPADVATLAASLSDNSLTVRVYGFIEYETMGKTMHHDFWYTRTDVLNHSPGLEKILGRSDVQKITQAIFMDTGRFEEYEMR
jgi:hypothetical protein